MKTFAFQNRLFLTYAAVVTLVVALFTGILIWNASRVNEQVERYHQQEVYLGYLSEIEAVVQRMDRLALQVSSSNEVLGTFMQRSGEDAGGNHFQANLIDAIRVSSLLAGINGVDNFAARISVFNRSGDYVSTGTLYETQERIDARLGTPAFYDEIMARVQASDGSVVMGFHEDTWSNNPSMRLVSLYRPLMSYTGIAYGLIDIQIGSVAFDRLPIWNGGEYVLLDRAGALIYPFDLESRRAAQLAGLVRSLPADAAGVMTMEGALGQERVVLMATGVPLSDWLLVRTLPESALGAPYIRGYWMMGLYSLVLLLCLVLVVYYLAARIAGPLGSLARTISGVNLQNMQQAMEETRNTYSTAELNALNDAFRSMLQRLDQSVSMEIQAHIRALQSQMNPHFLYNMLSVIIESSEEEGGTRTVSMCLRLSQMLRYIADYERDIASFADELAHTRNYLDLMKDRYEHQFSYAIEADAGVGAIVVPKLIVQPLTENCFSHGFRGCRPPWHIDVQVRVRDGRWWLSVTDNGSGMPEETVQSVKARVAAYRQDMAANYPSLRVGGMGLTNTLIRLSLLQQEDIHFSIESAPGKGTTIAIGGMLL